MRALLISAVLALSACSGDTTTGGGTADSPFVGTYRGSSTVTVTASEGSRTAGEAIAVFVNRDGLVQIGDPGGTIYASGPLAGDTVRISADAPAMVDPACSGTITMTGTFSLTGGEEAAFSGRWSSDDVTCFDRSGDLSGDVAAERVNGEARASRVFETNSPALLEAFRPATG